MRYKSFKRIASITMGLFLFSISQAQLFYRIEADFSIKEISANGNENLLMGKSYYDKNVRKIVSEIKFPQKEVMVITDSSITHINAGKKEPQKMGKAVIDFSVFNLFLNGDIDYYGLKNTPYELQGVEKDEDLVISTWILKDHFTKSSTQKMMLSQKDNKLYGLVTFDEKDYIVSKQLFRDYVEVEGMQFPSRIIQILYYPDGSQLKRITEYSNVILNSPLNNEFYYYKVPHTSY